jgi:hypothetical protein
MVSRLQRPIWQKALREPASRGRGRGGLRAHRGELRARGRRAPSPALGNVVAGRIANRLDLGGTNCVTDAACASSFSAHLDGGQRALSRPVGPGHHRRRRHAERHLHVHVLQQDAGAVEVGRLPPVLRQGRRHDARRGLGMVALKRLADAERDGDRIYAVLARRRLLVRRPREERVRAGVRGQAQGAAPRLRAGGLRPETVELVEAHGTGTKARATPPSSRACASRSASAAARPPVVRARAPSSRRSATPRPRRARRACSRP